jgi:hypothetical protein
VEELASGTWMMKELLHILLTLLAFCNQIRLVQNVEVVEAFERGDVRERLTRQKERGLLWRPRLLDATGFHFDFPIEISDHEISEYGTAVRE